MRLSDVVGVVAALVVGGILTILLLASAVAAPPTLPSPVPPSIPPLPTATPNQTQTFAPTVPPGATAGPRVGIGQTAPPLQVTLTDGSVLDTADYAGKPLWINFMATWCPQCQDELPLMERYQGDYGERLSIIVVDTGEDRQVVRQFMSDLNVDLPVAVDQDGSAQAAWGTYALPVHVFIDANGIVQDIVYGGAPLDVWDEALALIVPEFAGPSATPIPLSSP